MSPGHRSSYLACAPRSVRALKATRPNFHAAHHARCTAIARGEATIVQSLGRRKSSRLLERKWRAIRGRLDNQVPSKRAACHVDRRRVAIRCR